MTAVVIDNPNWPEDVAEAVAEFIRDGLTVERVTTAYSREHLTLDCPCQKQTDLFPEASDARA